MAQNLFEELQEKKSKLLSLISKAKEFKWIDEKRENEIREKLNNDTLTIGVIGQMKCGKSTFLNSFVFEDDILPAATTPMTAALSVITYGEKKKIVAEFYTKDEWEEQKIQASRSLDEVAGNSLEESKIKAAQELVSKSGKLGSSLGGFLGKTQDDSFENLIDYVGADGKYISITKSVTIYYPKDYLKGVEIVDTPGFNDPIVSREERTKAFLNKADVVLLMLYAGRPFDSTDRDILFKNVAQCGTGKVLIGINKYDIPYENGESEDDIKKYVKEQLSKACRECNDNLLVDVLQSADPIPLSAEMALLSELPMSKISSSEAYNFAWKRNCDNFEVSNQPQMRAKSHIDDLISGVKKVVETEKEEILFRKPLNEIIACGKKKKSEIDNSIQQCNIVITALNQPDDELEERQENIAKANKRIMKKINSLGEDLDSLFREIVRKGRITLEDSMDTACNKMDSIVDNMRRFSSPKSIIPQLERETQKLINRTLKREVEDIGTNAKNNIKTTLNDFFIDVEDLLIRYIPDFESRDFIKSLESEISLNIEDESVFLFEDSNSKDRKKTKLLDYLFLLINGPLTKLLLGNFLNFEENKNKMHDNISEIRNSDVTMFLDSIFKRKDELIYNVKERIIDELIEPLQKTIDDIVANKEKREEDLKTAQIKLETLSKEKSVIDNQLREIL